MKALIYENHDEINLNYIVNLVGKIERQRISKVSLVIVEVELFLKLREEGMKNGFFFQSILVAKKQVFKRNKSE